MRSCPRRHFINTSYYYCHNFQTVRWGCFSPLHLKNQWRLIGEYNSLGMLFRTMIIFNLNQSLCHSETEIAYLGKIISYIFQAITKNMIPEMGFGMTIIIGIVTLSAHSSSNSSVEDYETKKKTHTKIEI